MKNRKAVLRRALTGLAALCLVAVLLFGTASPAMPEVTGHMILKVDNEQILAMLKNGEKITLSLYRLSGRSGDYLSPKWNFVDPFDFASLADRISAYEEKVRTDKYPNDDDLLKEVEDLIKKNNVKAVDSGDFSRDGTVVFNGDDPNGLKEGLYFFMMTAGPSRVSIKSAIVPVPFVYKTAMYYSSIELTVKGSVSPTPPTPPPSVTPTPRPTPTPYIPPYRPPVNPNPPPPPVNPPQQNQNEIIIDDYDTPLGIAVEFNHVGDCYE